MLPALQSGGRHERFLILTLLLPPLLSQTRAAFIPVLQLTATAAAGAMPRLAQRSCTSGSSITGSQDAGAKAPKSKRRWTGRWWTFKPDVPAILKICGKRFASLSCWSRKSFCQRGSRGPSWLPKMITPPATTTQTTAAALSHRHSGQLFPIVRHESSPL